MGANPISASLNAECSLLGAILLDNRILFEVGDILHAEDFSTDAHRRIYQRMVELAHAGESIDPVILFDVFRKKGEVDKVGGAAYLSDLTSNPALAGAVTRHAHIVRENAERRQLARLGELVLGLASDSAEPVRDSLARISEQLFNIQAHKNSVGGTSFRDIAMQVLDEIVAIRERKAEVIGLTTGIAALDRSSTGIREDEYWVVGAAPSRGKTVLATQIAAVNAKQGIPVLFFSLEMTKRQLFRRVLAGESNVSAARIRDPRWLTDEQLQELTEKAAELRKWPFDVEDNMGISAHELVARARLAIRRQGTKLIVVDYLQRLRAPGADLRQQVSRASEMLCSISQTEGVPVVAVAALARPASKNENERPSMFLLRETGTIEYGANVVLLLYRPKGDDGRWTGEDEVNIAKQREGLVGVEKVYLNEQRLRFVERT